jgi:hypothetical protein
MADANVGGPPHTPGAAPTPWPPPGLELVHGRVWPIAGLIGFGDLVLGLPLLATLGTAAPFWSLGPFGDIWWLPLVATLIGGALLVAGLVQLVSVCRKAASAARQGHGWRTIVYAAVDRSRDTGFLLQRARSYSVLVPAARDTLLNLRVLAAELVLAAVLLVPAGLAASVIFGRLGVIGETFLWITAGVLPLLLLTLGILVHGAERWSGRAARRGAGRQTMETLEQVAGWNRAVAAAPDAPAIGSTRGGAFRLGAVGVAALTIAVVVPVGALVLVGGVVQILATVAMPVAGGAQVRLAAAEPLRRYRVETNAAISPTAAGQALNNLIRVGTDVASLHRVERAPVRVFRDPWWPADPLRDSLMSRARNAGPLFGRAGQLSAQERRYLTQVAAHPAHDEFRVVASARKADVIATRFVLPFPDSVNSWTLPIPRFLAVREAALAHVARAALELGQGRADRAEQTVREVIAVGFVLIDDGPSLIDNMLGAAVVSAGGDALEALYRATGRAREADALASVRSEVRRAAERTAAFGGSGGIEAGLHVMSRVVVDTATAPGFRWDYFGIVTTMAPCVSLQRLVFGPGESYRQWVAEARAVLVHNAGEEQLFALHQRGPFGAGRCLPPLWVLEMMRS